ncbi:type I restriction endonuclease subunit R [Deinococcus wulumuqiensis]|uniref:Type I restriction enzyme endonuclease subunit n=1 Tax=Deinococcus wulumuqiensis TaxID=980427 RepID=A0AAV4K7J9_9DEIO|nr:type I restriction endonuclease subunit R [Deinococcus wulumuqiensis]QII21496.1 type I restriction endonuclease subunit R [Deinococcus wulumuqiensis R12]GGI84645.1 DEAD/DEAH box helicase [Deinococcus wulumuqiensis]GGP29867.1 DEAD/DEAH box helicase [Deinococcus wulumuqiensis]
MTRTDPPADFREIVSSQLPALGLLVNLGYSFLTPAEALDKRRGRRGQVILTDVLLESLARLNRVRYLNQEREFTSDGLQKAADALLTLPFEAQYTTAQAAYDLLTLGVTVEQTIDGDRKSFSVKFIDWDTPENNVWHVTEEFTVERQGSTATRRPDIVLSCNGIPLVVIECKRPDMGEPLAEAISQTLRNHARHEIPLLYAFSQLLLGVAQNAAKYGTTGADAKYWATWREEDPAVTAQLPELVGTPLPAKVREKILGWRDEPLRSQLDQAWHEGPRLPSAQDELIGSLLSPARLLDFIRGFVVFDAGVKKVARYQQFYAVREIVSKVQERTPDGKRHGGVVWHTTGSGKSLTMVMLARALTHLPDALAPRIVLVTDRVDLDDQIAGTFKNTGVKPVQAKDGRHLLDLLSSERTQVITTVIDKFETVAREKLKVTSPDVFVLVDESHRSQYGSANALMRTVLPNACLIGFTGTPLLKKEKNTAQKFGGILHSYTMGRAVQDGAVAPLKYEARHAELRGAQEQIDRWFERVTRNLTEQQKADVKRQFRTAETVLGAGARLEEIAYDIGEHYVQNYQGRGLKAQFAVSSKLDAVRYKKIFERWGRVSAALVMSAPDTREGRETVDEADVPEVQAFWRDMMGRYGSEKNYQDSLIAAFKGQDGPELLIVVDKLLTGFDAPRNAVLYLDKRLKEHNILQAIARVNRLYDGKDYGLIVDYRGIFNEMREALDIYAALEAEGFDPADVAGTLESVDVEIGLLKTRHGHVWDVFSGVDRQDLEAMQRHLEPQDRRDAFYETLTAFAKTLQLALSTPNFLDSTPEAERRVYIRDLRFFLNLRTAVKRRYGESVDFGPLEAQLRKMVQEHVGADTVTQLAEPVSLFDIEAAEEQDAQIEGEAAKADTMTSRIRRAVTERMEEDPTFYKRLSELVDEAIADHRAGRLADLEYLQRAQELTRQARERGESESDPRLHGRETAQAYRGLLEEALGETLGELPDFAEQLTTAALTFDDSIQELKIRDWHSNQGVRHRMMDAMDDHLYELEQQAGRRIPHSLRDDLFEKILSVARHRDA